jgi:putative hydrolase of the HAD superfamily
MVLPRAILFDLDDTITTYDSVSVPAWRHACAVCSEDGTRFDPAAAYEAIRDYSRWFWSDPDRHRTGRLDMVNTRHHIVRSSLPRIGVTDDTLAARLADIYTERREGSVDFFPGAEETLVTIKARGVPMALLTNGEVRTQRRKVERFRLERFFGVILIEGEQGFGKPDERVYRLALSRLTMQPSDTWFVGDNLEWDIAAPQRLGIYAVWNDWRGKGLPAESVVVPDRTIRAIAELVA